MKINFLKKKLPDFFLSILIYRTKKIFLIWVNNSIVYVICLRTVLTKLFYIMDNVFKYFNGFFKGLTGLIMSLLGLGIAVEIAFGGGQLFGITVIDNVMAVINGLGGAGFVGLLATCVLWNLLTAK